MLASADHLSGHIPDKRAVRTIRTVRKCWDFFSRILQVLLLNFKKERGSQPPETLNYSDRNQLGEYASPNSFSPKHNRCELVACICSFMYCLWLSDRQHCQFVAFEETFFIMVLTRNRLIAIAFSKEDANITAIGHFNMPMPNRTYIIIISANFP